MASISAHAHARVGLLGNPSDLYGGRGLGFAVAELRATATLTANTTIELPNDLLRAGFAQWSQLLRHHDIEPTSRPFAIELHSDIPFQAGLSGSSALLLAALRAWSRWYRLPQTASQLAELAFRAENENLGIRAGPLDRLVQAHGGLLAMDFAQPFAPSAVQRLDPALLPPLLLAWHGQATQSSGDVHAPIWARFSAGDPAVREVMAQLAANADAGRAALTSGDRRAFLRCVDHNFELRARVFPIAAADRALIELGRQHGAGSKFPGSGGAVLYACPDEATRERLAANCQELGHATLRPSVAAPTPRLAAVFLAAGFATRLYPLTLHQAKPLLTVGGQALLSRILRQVEAAGNIEHGVVVTNHRFHTDFVAWAEQCCPRLPLTLVDDGATDNESRLGAIRDLALALASLPAATNYDGFLVLACDNLFDFDLGKLVAAFTATAAGQLIVRQVPAPVPPGKYSEVMLAGDRVLRFREKPAHPDSDLSAIAVYLLPATLPVMLDQYLATGGNPDAPGHLLAWLAQRLELRAQRLDGRWLDIGSSEDLAAANQNYPVEDFG